MESNNNNNNKVKKKKRKKSQHTIRRTSYLAELERGFCQRTNVSKNVKDTRKNTN